jgi:two-component system CitB family sensor kinase
LLVLLVLLTVCALQQQVRRLLHFGTPMKARMRRLLGQRLSTQVVIMMVVILVVTMAAGFMVVQWNLNRQLDEQYEQRSLAVAETLASEPGLQQAVSAGGGIGPHGVVQAMAMAAQNSTMAEFVVVTDARGIRLSHPNTALIGTPVWYPDREPESSEPFRTGLPWMGIQHGTLGVEATGKAPIFRSGKLIGQVSVGFLTATVAGVAAKTLPELALVFLGVLALGVLAALGLSRRLKRQTFGLELREIAALLQQREAMLHGIREGVLGYDSGERIMLANDFARQLLDLPPDFVGRPLRQVLPPGRLANVVTGEAEGNDLLVLHGDRVLVANRMPIRHDNRRHLGWVVTFQDRTESEALKRQLDDAIGLTETLRAQSHEFANRLHTLVGLVELGRYDEAIQFVTEVSAARADLTERLQADIRDAKLVALILAKISLADERDVRLRVMDDSHVDGRISDVSGVLTVVGNFIDNAIDAAAQALPGWVELTIVGVEHDLLIRVRDSGPGIPREMRDAIFMDGVTTKSSATGARRGLGLALVRQVVESRGGMISVGHDGGAVFTAVLPRCVGTGASPEGASPEGASPEGASPEGASPEKVQASP